MIETLASKKFETNCSLLKSAYYVAERWIGDLIYKKAPQVTVDVKLLNLGCGPLKYAGYCNADDYAFKRTLREFDYRPDWRLDLTKPWRCDNDYWDGIFCQHVIEHLTYSEAICAFQECFRTLKPGSWLRLSVPSLERYVNFYKGAEVDDVFKQFPFKALAFSFFTQMHFHKSVWDGDLMLKVLNDVGFCNAKEVEFGTGTDTRLLKDQACKKWESLYVEAQKPKT